MMTRTLLFGAVFALTACSEDRPLAGPIDLAANLPEGAVQAVVQQQTGVADGTMEYVVRVVGRRADMAAYQGAVTFAAGDFEVVSIRTPTVPEGEVHIVNSSEAGAGSIRFAAYAPDQFATDEAFTMVVKPLRGGLPNLVVKLDVAGTEDGKALDGTLLRASSGVRDTHGRLLK